MYRLLKPLRPVQRGVRRRLRLAELRCERLCAATYAVVPTTGFRQRPTDGAVCALVRGVRLLLQLARSAERRLATRHRPGPPTTTTGGAGAAARTGTPDIAQVCDIASLVATSTAHDGPLPGPLAGTA